MILVILLVIPAVALLTQLRWRWDLTEERAYSLSPATLQTLANLDDRLQIKLYFNRDIEGAESLLPARLVIEDLLTEIERKGSPWVSVETVDPTTDLAAMRDAEHVGVEPLPVTAQNVSGVSVDLLYQGLELRYQNRSEVIPFVTPDEFEFAFTVRLAELQRAQRPVIGMVSDEPLLPPQMPGMPRQVPAGRLYEELRVVFGQRYAVRDIDPSQPGAIASDIVAIVVPSPASLSEEKLRALDRYLAEGGHLLILQDSDFVDPMDFSNTFRPTGLEAWLGFHGVTVGTEYVFDSSANAVEVPTGVREMGTSSGKQLVSVKEPYGLGVIANGDGLTDDHVVTARLNQVVLIWAHPLRLDGLASGLRAETLIQSSPQSRLLPADVSLAMEKGNMDALNEQAKASGVPQPHTLAAAISGTFAPMFKHADLAASEGLMVVISNSELFHNVTLSDSSSGNAPFAANLADWLAQDAALIELRSRGKQGRPITDFGSAYAEARGGFVEGESGVNEELDRAAQNHVRSRQRLISWGNVLLPPFLVLLFALFHRSWHGRRARQPFRAGGKS
jgi:ABC-type uncharacterized transport system involved in gliding motility auxiliary subunit